MTTTDTSKKSLESLIVAGMAGEQVWPAARGGTPALRAGASVGEASALYGAAGWLFGHWQGCDREYAVGLSQDGPTRRKFLVRLKWEIGKRGVMEFLKQFSDNGSFRRWLTDTVFDLAYAQSGVVSYH